MRMKQFIRSYKRKIRKKKNKALLNLIDKLVIAFFEQSLKSMGRDIKASRLL